MLDASSMTVDVAAVIDRVRLSHLQWTTILLCGLVAILDGFDTQAIAFVAQVIARDLDVEVSAFGPVFGAGLLGLTVGALAFGPAADRWGRKPIIIASTFVFGAFALSTPLAASLPALMLYRFLTGLGLGGAMPNIIALTSEYSPKEKRSTLVTLMFCGFPLGAVLGGLISARLIAGYGWPVVFYLGGILPLLLLPFLWSSLPESIRFLVARGKRPEQPLAIIRRIDPDGNYGPDCRCVLNEEKAKGSSIGQLFAGGRAFGTCLLWVVFFSNLLILYFLINWLPTLLQQAGLPIERAIIATVVLNAGGIIGGLSLGRVVDSRQPFGILTAAYALAAVLVAAIGALGAGAVPMMLLTIFAAGFFVIGSQYCMNALAANFYPTTLRSTGIGWALGIGRIGSIIGPVVGGMVLSLGWSAGQLFVAAAAPAAVASLAVFLIGWQFGRRYRSTSEPQPSRRGPYEKQMAP
jgi:AAHS family 4-hydroxybenzoate transporter-like MFS transporter